jgi:hypothetical protein
MGNATSHTTSNASNYTSLFKAEELTRLRSVYDTLCCTSTPSTDTTTLLFWHGLSRLARQARLDDDESIEKATDIKFEGLLRAAAWLLRLDATSQYAAWWHMFKASSTISVADWLREAIKSVFNAPDTHIDQSAYDRLLEAVLSDAITKAQYSDMDFELEFDPRARVAQQKERLDLWLRQCGFIQKDTVTTEKSVEQSTFIRWLERSEETRAILRHYAETLLFGSSNAAFVQTEAISKQTQLLPTLIGQSRLLDQTDIWLLARLMPADCQLQWRCASSSREHGENWQQLLTGLVSSGATLIVVRERDHRRVFGGFAYTPWKMGPTFFGDSRCFLFTRDPLRIYTPSGYNQNYQYLNAGAKTLPNGEYTISVSAPNTNELHYDAI